MEINRLNVRVYGIMLDHAGKVLLVRERIGDFEFTKFPGGGMELGEGLRDCLIREFKEETGIDVEIGKHIYTTDFFQQSAFKKTDQLIAVYYEVRALNASAEIRLDHHAIVNEGKTEWMHFFWVPLPDLTTEMLTFPIDKLVCGIIRGE